MHCFLHAHVDKMVAHANAEEAQKCIAIAKRALSERDFAKAERFATKAFNMAPSDEVSWEHQKEM